jgi:DNA-binding response OmpR family regulator
VAPDGETALRHLDGGAFDVVVLDLMLPGMQGQDVGGLMRAWTRWTRCRVWLIGLSS